MNSEITPTGRFRIGMNGSNATLTLRKADGTLDGLSVDLARFIAGRLGVPFDTLVYASSTPYTGSFGKDEWEIVITGKNDVVAKLVDFGPDLFFIEYVYLAVRGSEFTGVADVDRSGVRIAVPRNASADVYLSKTLESAALVRVDGDADTNLEFLRADGADVYASSIGTLREMEARLPGSKILGAFQTITFSVAMRPSLPAQAQRRLTQLVNEAKAEGIVQKALEKAGAHGARVAP